MDSCSYRCSLLFRRRIKAALLQGLWLVFIVFSAPRARAIDLSVVSGYARGGETKTAYRPGTPLPLTVYLSGQSFQGTAQLQVSVLQVPYSTTLSRRVTLSGGLLRTAHIENFVCPMMPVGSGYRAGRSVSPLITVRLIVDGREIARKELALPASLDPMGFNILVLSRDGSGLNFLEKKQLGLVHRFINPNSENMTGGAIIPAAQLLYTNPESLPITAQGYATIDAIVLGDLPLDGLTDVQMEAIKGFVRQGGLLLVSGGSDLARFRSNFFAELLPVRPVSVSSFQQLKPLLDRYKRPLASSGSHSLLEGTLQPGAVSLFGKTDAGSPLISMKPYGNGSVVFAAPDLFDPALRAWKGSPSFWYDLLHIKKNVLSPCAILKNADSEDNLQKLAATLAGKQANTAPALNLIALFVGGYLFLLIPISYFVLKKIDRRELAWMTAPILILFFTFLAYLAGSAIKGGSLTANSAAVLETNADSQVVSGFGIVTIYSPRRATYDIALAVQGAAGHIPVEETPQELELPGRNLINEVVFDQDARVIREKEIGLWDSRSFSAQFTADIGGEVRAATKWLPRNQIQVIATNATSHLLHDCRLITPETNVPLGDLQPGESKTQVIHWMANSGSSLPVPQSPLSPDLGSDSVDTPAALAARVRNSLASVLSTAQETSYGEVNERFGRIEPALIGWYEDSLLSVQMDGRQTAGQETNLLYVHLPMPQNAPTSVIKAGNPFLLPPRDSLPEVRGPIPTRGNSGIFR